MKKVGKEKATACKMKRSKHAKGQANVQWRGRIRSRSARGARAMNETNRSSNEEVIDMQDKMGDVDDACGQQKIGFEVGDDETDTMRLR